MKRNYIVKLKVAGLIIILAALMVTCQQQKTGKQANSVHHESADTSLTYLLKPVNEQVIASIPVIKGEQGSQIYTQEIQGRITYDTRNEVNLSSRVSGRIEKLYIKYNYQPVKKGQLIMEIYSPDLAAAQRELLLIDKADSEKQMLGPARQRLILLGMSVDQIDKLLRTGRIQYRVPVYSNANGFILEKQSASSGTAAPASATNSNTGGMDNMNASAAAPAATQSGPAVNSAILLREGQYLSTGQSIFTIYQQSGIVAEFALNPAIAGQLQKDAKIVIQRTANREESQTGKIGLIQPVFNAGENFVLARVFLNTHLFQVGELITGQIPFFTTKGYWLPHEAILTTGNKKILFKKEAKVLVPKVVKTGVEQGGQIQVLDDISGWNIAKNAYYLIDSESFVKTQNKGQE
ncbi:efflux RND transporter periplasmic adaptor subunit [Pedobacter antarcticus]|uniref:efflux RND transporter periplasmic adaptor subunit n=1 Tax=Pedobacter antarcticus TaxID=34086 RepID=UPI002931522D|nr:efflux RND transporter periplasmic adaptor subunit [Pedobacter antarcticus]